MPIQWSYNIILWEITHWLRTDSYILQPQVKSGQEDQKEAFCLCHTLSWLKDVFWVAGKSSVMVVVSSTADMPVHDIGSIIEVEAQALELHDIPSSAIDPPLPMPAIITKWHSNDYCDRMIICFVLFGLFLILHFMVGFLLLLV